MMGKRQPFQQVLLGKLNIWLQKIETGYMSSLCTSINSKWIRDPEVRTEILKLVQDRVGNKMKIRGIGNNFLNRTQMAQQLRERIEK
jgi:hypothetical protein